jgi:hypothetical protein
MRLGKKSERGVNPYGKNSYPGWTLTRSGWLPYPGSKSGLESGKGSWGSGPSWAVTAGPPVGLRGQGKKLAGWAGWGGFENLAHGRLEDGKYLFIFQIFSQFANQFEFKSCLIFERF